jgi:acyl carrier protein
MQPASDKDFEASALEWVRQQKRKSANGVEFDCDTNLIEQGVLDSLGLLDLVVFVEQQAGVNIDLATVSPEDLVSIRGLQRHLQKGQNGTE